jgi:SAM-dependent methyltransferase/glycosyltransferase involved in cell wall biosynthesis
MKFDGERFIPESSTDGELEHLHRYLLACRLVLGKSVLDIASGEGYGSKMLAGFAKSVVGVDISEEAVAHAQQKYIGENLSFKVGSCAAIPFDQDSFDVVISFETIEHHNEHQQMLREIKRVLKPNGLLFISSPDKEYYSDVRGYKNEFHVKELYRSEFISLLNSYFPNVELLNQRILYGSAIFSEQSAARALTLSTTLDTERYNYGVREPLYLLALASAGDIPSLPQSVFETPLANSDGFRDSARRISQLEGMLEGVGAAFEDRDLRLKQSQTEVERISELLSTTSKSVQSIIIDRDNERRKSKQLELRREAVEQDFSRLENRSKLLEESLSTQSIILHTVEASVLAKSKALDSTEKALSEKTLELKVAFEGFEAERKLIGEECAREISKLHKSTSWRLTAPLRVIGRALRRFRNSSHENFVRPYVEVVSTSQTVKLVSDQQNLEPIQAETKRVKILLVSYYCPSRAHAGGLRILDIYSLIKARSPNTQIDLFTHHRPEIDWKIDDAMQIFDNVFLAPTEDLAPSVLIGLRKQCVRYDVIDLQFHNVGKYIDAFRALGEKILYTPMESLAKSVFLNVRTALSKAGKFSLVRAAGSIRAGIEEIAFVQKADQVVCVSRTDAAFLRTIAGNSKVIGLDTGVSTLEFSEAFQAGFVPQRAELRPCRILYLAYLGSETNVLALFWYLDHVHPIIKARVPGYTFSVVGRGDLTPFRKYRDTSVDFVGEVPTIAPAIKDARVAIAPALSGSGFRGKVNQYAILGCPSVISPISHRGLRYRDEESVFVAETPELFAERCIQLLTDFTLNDQMGLAARELCIQQYSWASKWPVIRECYGLLDEQ